MSTISSFKISGLFDNINVEIQFENNCAILVGPNGVGKSSIINILYLFLTRQWARLIDYKFQHIEVHFMDGSVAASRSDIMGISDWSTIVSTIPSGSRTRLFLSRLEKAGELEKFMLTDSADKTYRRYYAQLLGSSLSEVSQIRHRLLGYLDDDSLLSEGGTSSRVELERILDNILGTRVLYLPTYRRIEKDISDIFPDFEERFRRYDDSFPTGRAGRLADHYLELVSFGMEDVSSNITQRTQELRDYSLNQYNNLSGSYLRDVIQGTADQFDASQINQLSDDAVAEILGRVSEEVLPRSDKDMLQDKIKSMKGKEKDLIDVNDRFLAHYFSKLVAVHFDTSEQEQHITSFVDVCNKYLMPSKYIEYDAQNYHLALQDSDNRELQWSMLSSGEKQIVSIFAHLYLEQIANQIVIIDEPELSLSVPWQKEFLPDIIESGYCDFLLAVTHSPFIYDNDLNVSAIDVRRTMSSVS